MNGVSFVIFTDIEPDLYFLLLPFKAHGAHKKASEKIIERIIGGVVAQNIGHFFLLFKTGYSPYEKYMRIPPNNFKRFPAACESQPLADISIIKKLIPTLLFLVSLLAPVAHAQGYIEAPRITAALAQGLAAERGIGIRQSYGLAIELYCDAATMGSSEGFFRIGHMLSKGSPKLRNPRLANAYLALAARLGHREASMLHNPKVENASLDMVCNNLYGQIGQSKFDLDGYIAGLAPSKQTIAILIRKKAPQYGIDPRFALAIALAESNLDAHAVSPKNAQGVMQLIPETQERFGILKPFDPEQNIKGGLTYLKWLQNRFGGNLKLVAAAYNAGEGNVERYGGVPPFPETQQYVRRVLKFSGMTQQPQP